MSRNRKSAEDRIEKAADLTVRLAYPYLRYSTGRQSQGDSTRRQGGWFEQVCEAEGWQIDLSMPLADNGKSAYKGDHLKANLGRFLAAVNSGTVPRGSILLVEELDRLDRRAKKVALPFIIGLLTSGIEIRTRDRHYTEDSIDNLGELLDIIIRQGTAHEESRKKSVRLTENWKHWKEDVAAGVRRPPPGQLPPWVCWTGSDFALVPVAAETVKLIYQLAGDGRGVRSIVAWLNDPKNKRPPIGRLPRWGISYVGKLLSRSEVTGEFTDGEGTTYPGLFPAAVSLALWQRARGALEGRTIGSAGVGRGDPSAANLFVGLLHDATDGSRMHVIDKGKKGVGKKIASSAALRHEAGTTVRYFPAGAFEDAILTCLREIDPREILGQDREPDELLTLSASLKKAENDLARAVADMDKHGDSPVIYARARQHEKRVKQLADQVARARAKAAHPLSECWGEAKAALDAATDKPEARLRLRAALRRIVEEIRVLIVPLGYDRVCAVQVFFHGGVARSYLFVHLPARMNGHGGTPTRTSKPLCFKDVIGPDDFDMRQPADVLMLRLRLEARDLASISQESEEGA